MKPPRKFFEPLALGAPAPFRERLVLAVVGQLHPRLERLRSVDDRENRHHRDEGRAYGKNDQAEAEFHGAGNCGQSSEGKVNLQRQNGLRASRFA